MSSNDIVGLTSLSNDIDLVSKKQVDNNYVENNFNEKLLEEGITEISERLFYIELQLKIKKMI